MSSRSDRDRVFQLMAYADGELEGEERREVEGWIREDAEAVRLANDLSELGALVQVGYGDSSDGQAVAHFDIADAVMAKVEKESAPKQSEAKKVIALHRDQPRTQVDRQWGRSIRVGAAVVGALALAASVFLMMRNKEEEPMARAPIPAVQPNSTMNPHMALATPGGGVDVNVEQTPGNSVSVFYVPSETSLTTSVVVWVDEKGEK